MFQSGRLSQGYSQLLVRIMVQISWACNVMCTPVSTSDQVGQWVFQSGRVSQPQLLVRIYRANKFDVVCTGVRPRRSVCVFSWEQVSQDDMNVAMAQWDIQYWRESS